MRGLVLNRGDGIESSHERVMIVKALSELRSEGECVACRADFC